MAWKVPGSNDNGNGGSGPNGSGNGGQNPWPPRRNNRRGGNGNPLDVLRKLLGGSGGGNPLRWGLAALVVILLFNCFTLIGEQERGVVLRFGQVARTMQPGPNFKLPWPMERVIKVNATRVRTFSNALPVLTRDENIVTVSFNVQYRISDPATYLFGSRNADAVLQQIAQSAVREQIGRADLDSALNARGPLSAAAFTSLQSSLDAYRTGLVVTELSLQDARPPEEVKPAFDEVNSAQQMNERLVNEANAYAAEIVPEARGQAQRIRTIAAGDREAAIARATGDATRFSLLFEQYRAAPEVTRKRLWLETVESVLAQNRKVIGGDGRQLIYVPMPGSDSGAPGQPPVLPADVLAQGSSAISPALPQQPRNTPRPTRNQGASR